MIHIPGMSTAHVPDAICYCGFTFKFVLFVRISVLLSEAIPFNFTCS